MELFCLLTPSLKTNPRQEPDLRYRSTGGSAERGARCRAGGGLRHRQAPEHPLHVRGSPPASVPGGRDAALAPGIDWCVIRLALHVVDQTVRRQGHKLSETVLLDSVCALNEDSLFQKETERQKMVRDAECCHGDLCGVGGHNHRMVWVGRDLTDHPVPTPCHGQGHLPPDQVAQSPIQPGLEHCQGWGIRSFSGQPVPFKAITPRPITTCPCKESLSSLLGGPFRYCKAARRCPHSLLFRRLNNPSSPSLSSQERCSSPLIIFMALLWTCSNRSMSFLCWGPQSWTQYCSPEDVGFLGCKHTLPGHVELLINQHPQVLLRAALNPFSAQPVFVLGIALTHVQDFALGLAELHEFLMGPPLKPVKVPLDGIPSLQCVDCTTQLGVIGKLAEGALNPTVHVTDKDGQQHQSQYRPLRNATRHWSPLGHRVVDCNSLSVTTQAIPCPPNHLSLLPPSVGFLFVFEFVQKLLVHPCRPPGIFARLPLCWDALLLSLEKYCTKQIPEEAKVCSLEVQGNELAVCPAWCPKDLELHCFMQDGAGCCGIRRSGSGLSALGCLLQPLFQHRADAAACFASVPELPYPGLARLLLQCKTQIWDCCNGKAIDSQVGTQIGLSPLWTSRYLTASGVLLV
ncbi:hypothetical protein QYF61_012113 [Mycteria americana]|uniref:Uncharacterized protein n=1 Tax=Mycteria americana TaxID=33587 RepID=A0AAN7RXS6_MYCAM|nr:hypothetical protein QYF61_012113 [Mycteria americana]